MSGLTDSRRLFPRLIALGVSGHCFDLDTSPAPGGRISANKRSRLASPWNTQVRLEPERCPGVMMDGGVSEIKLLSVLLTGLEGTSSSPPPWNHPDRKRGTLGWTLGVYHYGPVCEGWQLIQIFSGSISWAAWGKKRSILFIFNTEVISTRRNGLFSRARRGFLGHDKRRIILIIIIFPLLPSYCCSHTERRSRRRRQNKKLRRVTEAKTKPGAHTHTVSIKTHTL